MSALLRRADAWLGAPAPAERLAVLRLVTSGFATGYLAVQLPVFLALDDAPASRFEPVGVLAWLGGPLPAAVWLTLLFGALVLGAASAAGAWFRVSGPGFAVLLLVVMTYRSSWGQLLWFETLFVLHVLVVGLAPSADALSVDARRSRSIADDDSAYGFPIRLAALVTATTYVLAGMAKLRIGGTDWLDGATLRNHIAYSAVRLEAFGAAPSPLARPFMGHGALFGPMAVMAVVVELAAPIALLGGRIRSAWVLGAWTMHAAIAALMFVVFPYPLMLVAFAPFYRLERLRPGALRLLRRAPSSVASDERRDRRTGSSLEVNLTPGTARRPRRPRRRPRPRGGAGGEGLPSPAVFPGGARGQQTGMPQPQHTDPGSAGEASEASTTTPTAAPSDNTTMTAILSDLGRAGWTGHMAAQEGGDVRCGACGTSTPASDLVVDEERRLEGASDPDDMTLVVAARCPKCATRATVVLGFGPNASAADSEVVAALPRTPPR